MAEKKLTKNLVFLAYFATMTILLLDCTDNFPGTEQMRKIKYLFIALLIADFIFSGDYLVSKVSAAVIIGLAVHTLVFCLIFTNQRIAGDTYIHLREMMIYLVMLFFLVNAVERYNAMLLFVELTAVALAVFFIWIGLTHMEDFVEPRYWLLVFLRDARVRHQFGMVQYNYAGFFCAAGLINFYIVYIMLKREGFLTYGKAALLVVLGLYTSTILVSTGSRGSILMAAVFFAVSFVRSRTFRELGRRRYVVVLLGIFFAGLIIYANRSFLSSQGTRLENFTVNWPFFIEEGRYWTGMGYVESSAFIDQSYGYATWPVDIYYLYIFFSTGILGFVMVTAILVFLFVKLAGSRNWFIYHISFPVYLASLFSAVGQVNLFTYRYIVTLFTAVLFLAPFGIEGRRAAGR